jgi:hypothetical protein
VAVKGRRHDRAEGRYRTKQRVTHGGWRTPRRRSGTSLTGKTDSSVRSSAAAAKKENVLSPIPIRFTSGLGRVHGENEFFQQPASSRDGLSGEIAP